MTTMRKIKIFTDDNSHEIESEVNTWLAAHQSAIIHNVLQSETYVGGETEGEWSLTITIFYYEGEGA